MTRFNLIAFIIIVFSTLIVVVVLFRFLRSEAEKSDKGYKLKGAAAGFVVIIGSIMGIFTAVSKINTIPISKHEEELRKWKPEKWTISAEIEKEGDTTFAGVNARYDPPEPSVQVDRDTRRIVVSDVLIVPNYGYPTIIFYCEGEDYFAVPMKIDNKNSAFEINLEKHNIKINTLIKLAKR